MSNNSSPVEGSRASGAGVEFDPVADVRWQRLWIAAQRRPWRSLAIVPSSPHISTLRIAEVLAAIGQRHGDRPIIAIDATNLPLESLKEAQETIAAHMQSSCVILALSSALESPTSLSLARAAHAALLAVALGETAIAHAERTIEEVGADRLIGSIVLGPCDKRA